MSVKLMAQVWELDLPHPQLLVGLALADHGKDDGSSIFPSVAHIAWKCGYSDRQVQRIIRELESRGLLVRVAGASGHRPVEYRMEVAAVPPKPPLRGDETSGRQDVTPYADVTPGVTNRHPRDDTTMSPKPSVEPSDNQGSSVEDPVAASPPQDQTEEHVNALCDLLSAEVRRQRGVGERSRQYRVTPTWRRECRALIVEDGYTPEQIKYAIHWTRGHFYWRRMILSMPRLRGEMGEVARELRVQRERREHLHPAGDPLGGYPPEARARLERTARRMNITVEQLLARQGSGPEREVRELTAGGGL